MLKLQIQQTQRNSNLKTFKPTKKAILFNGIKGKQANANQKFHFSVAQQTRLQKKKDSIHTNNKSFLEELSITPRSIKLVEVKQLNESIWHVDDKKSDSFVDTKTRLISEKRKMIMTALRDTDESDLQSFKNKDLDLPKIKPIVPILDLKVNEKRDQSKSPLTKKQVQMNQVNLVLQVSQKLDQSLKNSVLQQILLRKQQLIKEQHM